MLCSPLTTALSWSAVRTVMVAEGIVVTLLATVDVVMSVTGGTFCSRLWWRACLYRQCE